MRRLTSYRPLAAILLTSICAIAGRGQGVAIPYSESFEGPSWPGPEWTIVLGDPTFGRIQSLPQSPPSPDGGLAATFDVSVTGIFSTNTLTIAVDLAAAPAALLLYWAKETGDEPHPEDGLFLNDGIAATWPKVVDHANLTSTWTEITVGLAALAAQNGLTVTSDFRIRFSQRDNGPVPIDGLQIDGVRIVVPPDGQSNSAAASLDVNGGLNVLGQGAAAGLAGPFFASCASGSALVFSIQGPPNVPYLVAAGPLNPHNVVFPGVGSLDLGLLGIADLSDVAIVLDGTAPGFLNSLAWTGPGGASVLAFTMPAVPSGPWITFQAAIVNPPSITLTAAFQVSVP
jgi:hypothetical protein